MSSYIKLKSYSVIPLIGRTHMYLSRKPTLGSSECESSSTNTAMICHGTHQGLPKWWPLLAENNSWTGIIRSQNIAKYVPVHTRASVVQQSSVILSLRSLSPPSSVCSYLGNPAVLKGEKMRTVRNSVVLLCAIIFFALGMKRIFTWYKQQFVYSEEARRLLLAA